MQSPIILLALLGLVACAPKVPDSGAGVGFGDYSDYVRQREAEQTGQVGQPLNAVPTQPTFSTSAVGAALDNAETRTTPPTGRVIGQTPPVTNSAATNSAADTLAADRPRGDAPAGIRTETGEMQAATGISDEQDFKAVASRETISSDAERIARNRAQYEVIAPTALPQRDGSSGPSIVQFALSTTHAPGVQMYKRSSLFGGNGSGCAKFASPDLAQEAFLAKGGPEKDRSGLDPDGDGFACGWDPRPFRNALK